MTKQGGQQNHDNQSRPQNPGTSITYLWTHINVINSGNNYTKKVGK